MNLNVSTLDASNFYRSEVNLKIDQVSNQPSYQNITASDASLGENQQVISMQEDFKSLEKDLKNNKQQITAILERKPVMSMSIFPEKSRSAEKFEP